MVVRNYDPKPRNSPMYRSKVLEGPSKILPKAWTVKPGSHESQSPSKHRFVHVHQKVPSFTKRKNDGQSLHSDEMMFEGDVSETMSDQLFVKNDASRESMSIDNHIPEEEWNGIFPSDSAEELEEDLSDQGTMDQDKFIVHEKPSNYLLNASGSSKTTNSSKPKPLRVSMREKKEKIHDQKSHERALGKASNPPMLRKQHKDIYETVNKAKKLWEVMRVKRMDNEKRRMIVSELLKLIDGHIFELVNKHDGSRIVQNLLKWGTVEDRRKIHKGMKGHFVEMSQNKYSRFLLLKILRYGSPEMIHSVIQEFNGHVKRLVRHRYAAPVLDRIYSEYATPLDRSQLIQEWYGPEFVIFRSKDKRTLSDILHAEPGKKEIVLDHIMDTLTGVMDKGTSYLSFIHYVLCEFFQHADEKRQLSMMVMICGTLGGKSVSKIPAAEDGPVASDVKPEIKASTKSTRGKEDETPVINKPSVPTIEPEDQPCTFLALLNSREGVHCAMRCISLATSKERKVIIRALKGSVAELAMDEHAHWVLLRLFDSVDDTVLMGKVVLTELIKNMDKLLHDRFGHRVLLYLVCSPWRSTRFFSAQLLQALQLHDSASERTSKKDPSVRRRELKKIISSALLDVLIARCTYYDTHNVPLDPSECHVDSLICSVMTSDLVQETILHAEGNKRPLVMRFVELAEQPPFTKDEKCDVVDRHSNEDEEAASTLNTKEEGFVHILEHHLTTRLLKRFIRMDLRIHRPTGTITYVEFPERKDVQMPKQEMASAPPPVHDVDMESFAFMLCNALKPRLVYWATRPNAAFVVLSLLENKSSSEMVMDTLTPHITELEAQPDVNTATQLLIQKLKA